MEQVGYKILAIACGVVALFLLIFAVVSGDSDSFYSGVLFLIGAGVIDNNRMLEKLTQD